jgi:hypothetical protein
MRVLALCAGALLVLWAAHATRAQEDGEAEPTTAEPAPSRAEGGADDGADDGEDGDADGGARRALADVATFQADDGPRQVYVGVYMHHVPELDLQENSYIADFYLWFRWQGDDIDPSQSFELTNLVEGWDVMRNVSYTNDDGEPEPADLGDGWRYQVMRIQARFAQPFDVHRYPFDHQEINVDLEDVEYVSSQLVYVPDEGTYSVHPGLAIPGWTLDGVDAHVTEIAYPTNFGDTRRPAGEDRYSHFTYTVRVIRPVVGYLVTTVLPVAIVMLITFVMFLIDSKYFEGRLGLGITSLISAVALQLTAQSDLPSAGYLVLLDHVYHLAYLAIFFSLLESVVAVRLADAGQLERSKRLDVVALVVVPLFFFGGIGILLWTA